MCRLDLPAAFTTRTWEKLPWTISRQDLGQIWTEQLRKTRGIAQLC